ncbi:hypothetical protein BN159_7605 [Streptomyces davaonensis JCM 4913]|uniref:Uncharacterized protein n=1 Tax=Streptomyces davaonensis (strain DSM 101723 / JCM 4913 / KCC S-0913 / 768) TaxID=1214101 RepID=K4RFU4_STRDJ|nr:hypothetical protein BN159_7605 [Streptomyces davaonensis JCM 4913]
MLRLGNEEIPLKGLLTWEKASHAGIAALRPLDGTKNIIQV